MNTPAGARVRAWAKIIGGLTILALIGWRFGAGPNTSPRRLWAIIMWSRTVTLNIAHSPSSIVSQ